MSLKTILLFILQVLLVIGVVMIFFILYEKCIFAPKLDKFQKGTNAEVIIKKGQIYKIIDQY